MTRFILCGLLPCLLLADSPAPQNEDKDSRAAIDALAIHLIQKESPPSPFAKASPKDIKICYKHFKSLAQLKSTTASGHTLVRTMDLRPYERTAEADYYDQNTTSWGWFEPQEIRRESGAVTIKCATGPHHHAARIWATLTQSAGTWSVQSCEITSSL